MLRLSDVIAVDSISTIAWKMTLQLPKYVALNTLLISLNVQALQRIFAMHYA